MKKDIRRQRCRRISFFIEGQCLSESILYVGLLGNGSALHGERFVWKSFWVSAVFPVGCG